MTVETAGILGGVYKVGTAVAPYVRLSATSGSAREITFHLRDSVCEFQMDFANYHFECSSLHKDFKKKYANIASDPDAVIQAHEALCVKSASGLARLLGKQKERLEEYFQLSRPNGGGRHPSISVHLVNAETDDIERVIPNRSDTSRSKQISNYTAFSYVDDHGIPYCCNNTPKRILKGDVYKYGGLDFTGVRESYSLRKQDRKIFSRWGRNIFKKLARDDEWNQMILGDKRGTRNAFKSHLIVPITFRKHLEGSQLDPILTEVLELSGEGRSILGFLAVDHPETYYFEDSSVRGNQNLDVNTLYIHADMLSLIVLMYMTYTDQSSTVSKFRAEMADLAAQ